MLPTLTWCRGRLSVLDNMNMKLIMPELACGFKSALQMRVIFVGAHCCQPHQKQDDKGRSRRKRHSLQ